MFEKIKDFMKKFNKKEEDKPNKEEAKERLHLVLMQDRANVSADFLDMMKQEIIDVIKKYFDVDENEIDVKLTNKQNSDGTVGAPALYANIPIKNIKNEARKINNKTVIKNAEKEQQALNAEAAKKEESKPENKVTKDNKTENTDAKKKAKTEENKTTEQKVENKPVKKAEPKKDSSTKSEKNVENNNTKEENKKTPSNKDKQEKKVEDKNTKETKETKK